MKKSISIAIIMLLIVGILGGCVNAASVNINVKASTNSINIGDIVKVTVSFSSPVSTASFSLNYDNSKLQYESDTIGGTNTGSSVKVDYIDIINLKAISSATFTFKAKAEGTATCKVSGVVASDAEANELSASIKSSATITIVDNTKKEEEKPSTPSTPTTPNEPSKPTTPNESSKPSTPTTSTTPNTSSKPTTNNTTSKNTTTNKNENNQQEETIEQENIIIEEQIPEKVEKEQAPNQLIKLENEEGIITLKHESSNFIVKGIKIAIEEGTVLDIKEILEDNENYEKLNNISRKIKGKKLYFDIEMLKDEVKIQPNGYVTVFIPIPEDYAKERIQVYYLNEETETYELIQGEIQDNYYTFTINHFSKYALVEKTEPKTLVQILQEVITNVIVLYVIIGTLVIVVIIETIIIMALTKKQAKRSKK